MLSLRCRLILRHIPTCFRKLSITAKVNNPITIKMPALSPTMTEGGIVAWLKKEGEEVSAGDGLCEIQTDKAVVTMEVEEDGILAKIIKPDNSVGVIIGEPIAVIAEDGEDWRTVPIPEASEPSDQSVQSPSSVTETASRESPDAEYPPRRDVTGSGIGPAVRLLLELYHLHPLDITATGPFGRLLKGDVLAHVAAHQLQPQPPKSAPSPTLGSEPSARLVKSPPPPLVASPPPAPATIGAPQDLAHHDIQLSSEQLNAARRSEVGKRSIPHAYASVDVSLDRIASQLAPTGDASAIQFVVKAVANALQVVPEANSCLATDSQSVTPRASIDIAVSMASVSNVSEVKVVRNADRITSTEIAALLHQQDASNEPVESATFTVVDLTGSSVAHAASIVTPPQACVLVVGGLHHVPSCGDDNNVKLSPRLTATLSMDRRVLDEVVGAHFLAAFKSSLENLVAMPPVAAKDPFDDILGIGLD